MVDEWPKVKEDLECKQEGDVDCSFFYLDLRCQHEELRIKRLTVKEGRM